MKIRWAAQTGTMVRGKDMPGTTTVAAAILLPAQSFECKMFGGAGSTAAEGMYLSGHTYLYAVRRCKYY